VTSTRGGWRNNASAQMADQIQEDPLLLLEALDRINHLARGQSLAGIIDQAGHEAAAAWYGRLDTPPPRPDGVDWQQIGEHLLLRMLRNSLERDL
jgi:hypothetical protein